MNGPGSCYEGPSWRWIAVQYGSLAFRSRSFIRNVWRFRWHRTGNAKHLIDLGCYMVKFRAAPQLRHAREGQFADRKLGFWRKRELGAGPADVGEIGIGEEPPDLFRGLPERAERLAGDLGEVAG